MYYQKKKICLVGSPFMLPTDTKSEKRNYYSMVRITTEGVKGNGGLQN